MFMDTNHFQDDLLKEPKIFEFFQSYPPKIWGEILKKVIILGIDSFHREQERRKLVENSGPYEHSNNNKEGEDDDDEEGKDDDDDENVEGEDENEDEKKITPTRYLMHHRLKKRREEITEKPNHVSPEKLKKKLKNKENERENRMRWRIRRNKSTIPSRMMDIVNRTDKFWMSEETRNLKNNNNAHGKRKKKKMKQIKQARRNSNYGYSTPKKFSRPSSNWRKQAKLSLKDVLYQNGNDSNQLTPRKYSQPIVHTKVANSPRIKKRKQIPKTYLKNQTQNNNNNSKLLDNDFRIKTMIPKRRRSKWQENSTLELPQRNLESSNSFEKNSFENLKLNHSQSFGTHDYLNEIYNDEILKDFI